MPWWAPLAIIGGALVGAAVGALLLIGTPSSARRSRDKGRLAYEETNTTNYVSWNPKAFLVIGAILAIVVGLAIGLSVG